MVGKNLIDGTVYTKENKDHYINNVIYPVLEDELLAYYEEQGVFDYKVTTKDKKDLLAQANALVDAYLKTDNSDAQGYITIDRWKQIMQTVKVWTSEHQKLYDRVKTPNSNISWKDINSINVSLQPLKGQYSALKSIDNQLVPIYLKYSQAVITPKLASQFPEMQLLLDKMGTKVDEVVYTTGSKASGYKLNDIDSNLDSIIELDQGSYKIQVDQTAKNSKKEESEAGSQLLKAIITNIDLFGEYTIPSIDPKNNITGKDLVTKVDELLSKRLSRNESLLDNISSNFSSFIETLDIDEGSKSALIAGAKIESLPDSVLIERAIASKVRKEVIKFKFFGGDMIQSSPHLITGSENRKNKLVRNIEDTNIRLSDVILLKSLDRLKGAHWTNEGEYRPAQIFIPYNFIKTTFGDKFKDKSEKEIIEVLRSADPKLFEGVSYRIPTQPWSSIQNIEIAGILPTEYGDQVIVWDEGTTEFGFDFDIDKLRVALPYPQYNELTGKLEIKKTLENQILEIFKDIIKDPSIHVQSIKSLDSLTQTFSDIVTKYHNKEIAEGINWYSPINQISTKINNKEAQSNLTGTFAVAVTDFVRNVNADLKVYIPNISNVTGIKTLFNVNNYDSTVSLSNRFDVTKKYITEALSAFLSKSIDVAKDPEIIQANITSNTVNVVTFLSNAGMPLQDVMLIIGQPVLKIYNKQKTKNKSIVDSKLYDEDTNKLVSPVSFIANKLSTDYKNISLEDSIKFIINNKQALKNRLLQYKEEPNNSNLNSILDANIFAFYTHIEKYSNLFNDLTLASRFDVDGPGKGFMDVLSKTEQLRKALKYKRFKLLLQ